MAETDEVRVEELRLQNYRAFANARLALSDLTLLVGRNGAGKSSLLDAVELLREAVTDSLENALDRRGGLANVRRMRGPVGGRPRTVGVAVVLLVRFPTGRESRVTYGFQLVGVGGPPKYAIRERLQVAPERTLSFVRRQDEFDTRTPHRGISPPSDNLVLPLCAKADSLWGAVLDTIRRLRAYEISPTTMASDQPIEGRTALVRSGANAGDVLKHLEGTEAHRWICRHLEAVTEGIADVRPAALLRRRVLEFRQAVGTALQPLDAGQVSQGTLRTLGVLLALRQERAPSLVLVDEIENSVHPAALGVLLDAAEACLDRTRVVYTSHSPEVLGHPAARGDRVRVIDWRDGTSRVFLLGPGTRDLLDPLTTVGDLLRSNALWPADSPEEYGRDLFAVPAAGA